MTFTKSLFSLAVAGLLFVGCKDSATSNETGTITETETSTDAPLMASGKIETASFDISGMTCAMGCAKTIEENLSKVDGVQKATVDFETKTATVEYDNGKQSPEKLIEVVEKSADGKTYKVENVKSSADHASLLPQEKTKAKSKKADSKKADSKKECSDDGKKECCSYKKENKA